MLADRRVRQEYLKHPSPPASSSDLDDNIDSAGSVLENIEAGLSSSCPYYH